MYQSLAFLVMLAVLQKAPVSLLTNGNALRGGDGWTAYDRPPRAADPEEIVKVRVKTEIVDGVPCFTVRRPGEINQVVELPPSTAGWYAAIVGRGQAVRDPRYGSITGLPYLHASVYAVNRRYFLEHWQGQDLRAPHADPGEWRAMSGLFLVPKGAAAIVLRLKQASHKGDPRDESEARFTDVRLVLFPKESAARKYIDDYRKGGTYLKSKKQPAETATQFYLRWRSTALNAKSVDQITAFWTSETVEQFNMEPDSARAGTLAMVKRVYSAQTDVEVVKETATPNGATLSLEGRDLDKKPLVGSVEILKENGAWRIGAAVEQWKPKGH